MSAIQGFFIGLTLLFSSLYLGTLNFLHIPQNISTSTLQITNSTSQNNATSTITIIYAPDGTKTNLGKDSTYLYVNNGNGWQIYGGLMQPQNFDTTDYYFVSGLDTQSFISLNQNYFKDKNRVYWMNFRGEIIIKDADPATFHLVSGQSAYDAQDKNNKYLNGQIVQPVSQTSATADNQGFSWIPLLQASDYSFTLKNNEVHFCNYFNNEGQCKDEIILGADPTTFQVAVVLSGTSTSFAFYAKDKNAVYHYDPIGVNAINVVKGADPATFIVVQDNLKWDAQDKNHFYVNGQTLI